MSYDQKISDRVNYIKNILLHLPDGGQWEVAESKSDDCVYIRCTSEYERQKERVFGYYKKTTLSGFICDISDTEYHGYGNETEEKNVANFIANAASYIRELINCIEELKNHNQGD